MTTLSAWAGSSADAEAGDRDVAWLTVEAEDADPWRFWSGIVFAIRRVRPDVRLPALPALVHSADRQSSRFPASLPSSDRHADPSRWSSTTSTWSGIRPCIAASGATRPPATDRPPGDLDAGGATGRAGALSGLRSQREIADQLYVSRNTVNTQLRRIYRKLGVSTRTLAVARARELGLLE